MSHMDTKSETHRVRTTSIGWLLKRLSSRLDGQMASGLMPLGLDLTSFAVLMTVLEHSPLSQVAIAERLGMPPYKVSRALDHLEQQGYVGRHADPASRRSHVIRPTDAGAALAPQMYDVVDTVNGVMATGLTPDERVQLVHLLSRMVAAQDAREGHTGTEAVC